MAQSNENVSAGWNKFIVVANSIHDGHYCAIMGGLQYVNVIDTDLNKIPYAVFTDAIAMLCASPIMIIIDTTNMTMDTSFLRSRWDNLIVSALAAGLSFLCFGSTVIPAIGFEFGSFDAFVDGFQFIGFSFEFGSVDASVDGFQFIGFGFEFGSVDAFVDGFQSIGLGFALFDSVVDIVSGKYTSVEDLLPLALCMGFCPAAAASVDGLLIRMRYSLHGLWICLAHYDNSVPDVTFPCLGSVHIGTNILSLSHHMDLSLDWAPLLLLTVTLWIATLPLYWIKTMTLTLQMPTLVVVYWTRLLAILVTMSHLVLHWLPLPLLLLHILPKFKCVWIRFVALNLRRPHPLHLLWSPRSTLLCPGVSFGALL